MVPTDVMVPADTFFRGSCAHHSVKTSKASHGQRLGTPALQVYVKVSLHWSIYTRPALCKLWQQAIIGETNTPKLKRGCQMHDLSHDNTSGLGLLPSLTEIRKKHDRKIS